ncbi:MAG: hypothetical protein ABIQ39_11895 [Ilumatobacteraceae bacterium]
MANSWITRGCVAVFVAGIAGIIVTSVVNNNNGLVLAIGGCTTAAAVVLIAISAVATSERIEVFADADAERLEQQIDTLVAEGADESGVRALVREALRLGHR